jgi:8-oxo-dGTP pyrophosphatase MutT (NUDIX family)
MSNRIERLVFEHDYRGEFYIPPQSNTPIDSAKSLRSVVHDSLDLVEDPKLRSFGNRALEILLDHLKAREPFPLLFNGDMFSLVSERNGEVRLGVTSYFSFLLTNYLSSDKLWQEAVDLWLPGHVENRSTPLDSSIRANPLSVHVNLVTMVDDSYRVLISHRSDTNLNSGDTYSHTAGGSLERDDLVSFGNRAIHRAGLRELKEELGIEVPIDKIVVADWFISCKVLDPIVVAVALIPDVSMLRWQQSSETISADWYRLEDVVEHATRDPLDWHYDTLDDIAATVDALKILA